MASAHGEIENAIVDDANISASEEAEGDIMIDNGSEEEGEEENIEEDLMVDHKETTMAGKTGGSGSDQLKTPEDKRDVKDISDAHAKGKTQDAHQNKMEEAVDQKNAHHMQEDIHRSNEETTTSPQTGTAAAIPVQQENNTVAAQSEQVPGVIIDSDDSEESAVVPGVTFVPGPGYTGTGTLHTGYDSAAEDDSITNEAGVVLEGFLPEDDPSRRRNPHFESLMKRVQRLFDNAITLEESDVRPIPDEEVEAAQSNGSGGGGDDEAVKSDDSSWFLPLFLIVIAGCVILAIALPISLRRKKPGNSAQDQDMTASLSDAVCLPGSVDARFKLAKSILSSITSPDLLEDESSPQGKAIRWVVCEDFISVQLLGNQDPTTGTLPKQKHGFRLSGDAGEEQVTRRYILATVLYSTSQDSPWIDSLNFLSPDLHECNWHMNYTRHNFPFGEFDPVGVFCIIDKGDFSAPIHIHDEFLLDDENYPLRYMEINMRTDNNLNGPLPPEFGYLSDLKSIGFENNMHLTGQLPQTMGSLVSLTSITLILNGPAFGGELPSSLFQLRKLTSIHIEDNLGENWSFPSNVQIDYDVLLERLLVSGNSVAGTIPTWLAQLKHLQTLDLSTNNFHGSIPEVIGDISSLKYLNLMENNLTETIPSTLGNLVAIEALILGKNKLQGELPSAIGNLQKLLLLDVGSNEMTSTIPSSFANLESLKYLVLESNRFNGTVDVLEQTKKLTKLMIRSNSFSGSLPGGLFSETDDDVDIDIGDNMFTDFLPASFANISSLVSLIGAKNSFEDGATLTAVCDSTSLLVMDCNACECCEVCCDGENDFVCDFQLDVRSLLGYDCGTWFGYCIKQAEFYAEFGIY